MNFSGFGMENVLFQLRYWMNLATPGAWGLNSLITAASSMSGARGLIKSLSVMPLPASLQTMWISMTTRFPGLLGPSARLWSGSALS
jgi:hypothetical protein